MIHLYLLPYNHLQRAAIRLSVTILPVFLLNVYLFLPAPNLSRIEPSENLRDVSNQLVRYADDVRFYAIALLHHAAETSHIICGDLCALRILICRSRKGSDPVLNDALVILKIADLRADSADSISDLF